MGPSGAFLPVFEELEARWLLDGTVYYVDHANPLASDSNPGTEALPLLTVQRGVNLVHPGDTVLIKGSADPNSPDAIYNVPNQNGITPQRPGQQGQTITIAAAPGQTVILQGNGESWGIDLDNASYYTFSGLVFRDFNKATEGWAAKTDILIDHCEFTITYETGLRLRNVTNFTMQDCYVHNCFEAGITVLNGDNVTFERVESSYNDDGEGADGDGDGFHTQDCGTVNFIDCVARGNSEDGFDLTSDSTLTGCVSAFNNVCNLKLWRRSDDNYAEKTDTVINSIFVGGGEAGIKVSVGASLYLYNSVIYGNGEEGVAFRGIGITQGPAVVYSEVVDCIIAHNGYGGIEVLQSGPNVNQVWADHNLYDANGRANVGLYADTSFIANQDPLFISAAGEDFHLQAGSPAIDAGIAVGGVAFDMDHDARPYGAAPDIGADEWMPDGISNHDPVASDDAFAVDENSGANLLDVMTNDHDADGDPLRIIGKTDAAHGSVAILGDRSAVVYTPAQGYSGPDTFRYTISDGRGGAASATVTITVVYAPTVEATAAPLMYKAGDGAVAVDPGLVLSDPDGYGLQGATVWISASYVASQDALGFADQNGIAGHFDASTGTLTLTGAATAAEYQAALRSVTYLNGNPDPQPSVRTVSFQVSGWQAESAPASRAVIVGITPPTVVAVALNPDPLREARGVSSIDPSGIGVKTVVVQFSKPVTFDEAAVRVETVTFDGATGMVAGTAAVRGPQEGLAEAAGPGPDSNGPAVFGLGVLLTGSGTDTMTITFGDTAVGFVDTWVKVTLNGEGALMDAYGLALDGEPRAGGSGQSYIYSAALDLPTGDGTPGGDAVFYVGSLRGDYCGPNGAGSPPDGELTSNDVTEFHQKYVAGSLDADFRAASGTGGPDDRVTSSDVLGFKYVYTHPGHIGPLPSVAGGGTVGLAPLIGADGSVSAMAMRADTPEAPILPGDAAAPAPTAATSGTTDALSVAAPVLYVSASGGTGGDSAAGVSSSASAALVPGAPTAPSVPSGADLDPDGGLVDALASAQPAAAMAV